jgi:predicted transcriptional regulator
MKNRQKDDISRDILSVCNGGATITKVMFSAYMTHSQTKLYLNELMGTGLIENDPLTRKFYTTPKGLEYLGTMYQMAELFPVNTKRSSVRERLASSFI